MFTDLTLPFRFNPNLLQNDLARLTPPNWSPHYNSRDYAGAWQGAALRSPAGISRDLHAGHAAESAFHDTLLLDQCPYFREILAQFHCPLRSVRLLSLAPASFIREHSDPALGFEDGEVRLHIPILTNPDVEFYLCGERLLLEAGGCYYLNVSLPHRVSNRGPSPRIHLVIDAKVNSWVRALFENCAAKRATIPRSQLPPRGFNEFSDLVFSNPALRDKLRAIPGQSALTGAIVAEAVARGFNLNDADVQAAARSTNQTTPPHPESWLPVRIHRAPPSATWIDPASRPFTDPFFEDTVQLCLRDPFTSLFRREIPLPAIPTTANPIHPDGFIFHISRCGSTLISRSLAAADSTCVLSEPPPLDDILQAFRAAPAQQQTDWLIWIVTALANARRPTQSRFLIKLDAWHVHSLPLFRAAFPDTPWIFVYREPLEILASHARRPGLHTSPGAMDPAILGLHFADITGLTRRQWAVRVFEDFMKQALNFRRDPQGMYIDYRELPAAIAGKIAHHFNLQLTPEEISRVHSAARRDSKNPVAEFEPRPTCSSTSPEAPDDPATETLRTLYRELASITAP